MTEEEQLEAGIATLEAQRGLLGDAVVAPVLVPLRARLEALREQAQAQADAQALRQVTVLFIGLSGGAALSERLDPETLASLLDPVLQACKAVVQAHGGAVLQTGSDSLLAAFGARQAREDDPERAVQCALALRPLGSALALQLQRHGEGPDQTTAADTALAPGSGQLQLGLHTGPVLLGGGVDLDGTIRGSTVNLAARMQQTAPPGGVRVSRDTWRLLADAFEGEPQPPLAVKGQAQPMATWLVRRRRPPELRPMARGVEGLVVAMVGREEELARLCQAYTMAAGVAGEAQAMDAPGAPDEPEVPQAAGLADGAKTPEVAGPDGSARSVSAATAAGVQACTVLADAGLGKSRLLQELLHWLRSLATPPACLLGRAQASASLQPYGLLRDVLARQLHIADSDSAQAARDKLVQGLAPWLGTDSVHARQQAELLGQLVGMDFSASAALAPVLAAPRQLRDRALVALTTLLRALARQQHAPVVLLLDDLQWADDASLDALAQLQAQPDLPLLLLMAARPGLLERRPDWAAGWRGHQRLHLVELPGTARSSLTRQLLQRLPEVPDALQALIDDNAQGNPFYAEELVKMLIDDGVIEVRPEGWHLAAERLELARVPATLTGVLQARLDALAAPERRAMQWASVVGPVFWDQALSALDAQAPAALAVLQQRALVQARPGSAFAGTQEHGFQHHLLHQVTYETVLKGARRAGHARVAAWLSARVGGRSAEYLAIAAEHCERAGEFNQAFDWFERAAREARSRFANSATMAYVDRAFALPLSTEEPAELRRRYNLLLTKGFCADLLGQRDVQAQALQQRMAMAEALDDDHLRAEVMSAQALLADRVGERQRAGEFARAGLAVAERCGAAAQAAICWGELSWLSRQLGDLAAAQREVQAGLVWARRARQARPQDDMYEMQLLAVAAAICGQDNDLEGQRKLLLQALALADAKPEPRIQVACHQGLAEVARQLGEDPAFEQHIGQLSALADVTGAAVFQAAALYSRARRALDHGLLPAALDLGGRAERIYGRVGPRDYEALALVLQALALIRLDRLDEARASLGRALALDDSVGTSADVLVCRVLLACVNQLASGQPHDTSALQALCADLDRIDAPGALGAAAHGLEARLAAWQLLRPVDPVRAQGQLALAADELRAMVARLSSPALRQRVLVRTAVQRELLAACTSAGVVV